MEPDATPTHAPAVKPQTPARRLVFGSTGYIGSHLVPRLLLEGGVVRASGRNHKTLAARGWGDAELVEADALQPATLGPALQGVDTAYYLVHSMAAGHNFGALDIEAAQNFAAAAAAAGVRRIVYLGGLIPADPKSEHLVSRRDTGVCLRQGSVPVIEVRAGIIVGPGSAAYEVIRDLVNHLPLMLTPRWVDSKSAPIALDNLIEYLVQLPHIDAAAGVRRIVYLGGLIPADPKSEHLVSRRDTGVCLRQGSVPVTEVRAGIIVGPGSAAYEVIRDLVNHLPLMLTPRWVDSKSAPIALDNLIEYLVQLPHIDAAAGQVLDAAGPDYISYREVMLAYGRVVGRKPVIIAIPFLTPTISSYWLGMVTAVPASIARALIGGLKHDLPADIEPIQRLVPQRLLGFGESLQAALDAERRQQVAARWTEGLLMFRGFSIDNAYYAKRAGGTAVAEASPEAVWRVVSTLGGDKGYFYMGWLWWVRGFMDWLIGGPGLTKGRRHPTELRLGDRIDYWTVLGIAQPQRLTLNFGMRSPGSGVLEFEIDPQPAADDGSQRSRVSVTAYWHPQGVWGLMYWYVLVPAHLFLFKGMTRAIARRAEAMGAPPAGPADR